MRTFLLLLAGLLLIGTAGAQDKVGAGPSAAAPRVPLTAAVGSMPSMTGVKGMDDMEGMSPHMRMTALGPAAAGDEARAAAIVATLKQVLPRWQDWHTAIDAGFEPFVLTPGELKTMNPPDRGHGPLGNIIHFTLPAWAAEAQSVFDPGHPTSLLYRWSGKDKLELVGAMYTAPPRLTPEQLNARVPLSIARWHEHIDLCIPPRAAFAHADWTKFGPEGSITTAAACDAAGGRFFPRLYGWMVHVYPFETTPAKIWAH